MPPASRKATSSADTPDLSNDPTPPPTDTKPPSVARDADRDDTSLLNELALQSAKGVDLAPGGPLAEVDPDEIGTRELVFSYRTSCEDGREYMVARVHRDGVVRADRPSEEDGDAWEKHLAKVQAGEHYVVRQPGTGRHRIVTTSQFDQEFGNRPPQSGSEDPYA